MDRLFRIDFYPADWLMKTNNLNPEQRGVYIQICALIYQNMGAIENDSAMLGRMSNCSSRKAAAIVSQLVALGKLSVDGSKISQGRCERELNKKRTHLECSSKGGQTSGEKRAKSKENNDITSTPLHESLSSSIASPIAIAKEIETFDFMQAQHNDYPEFAKQYPILNFNTKKANAEYINARKKGVTHKTIMEALEAYKQSLGGNYEFMQHPQTWLAAEGYKKEYKQSKPQRDWKACIDHYNKTKNWPMWLGPPPGDSLCECPAEFLKGVSHG